MNIMTDEEYKQLLHNEVVDAGLCTFCGLCAAICPNGRIEFKADGPILKEEFPINRKGDVRVSASAW